ncbi:hypothetical protein KsCSTR_20880 [Candidatus Kuenenia stuttgartiensis]|uniref:Uncharacterized protein n=1 Tax=Kuenenia stuttgartiensis TaxID=174633 RepID=Q1Q2X9_KUEST|nr:hypothetical protein KsCSTR_20880 [Candidatus Kuenenia stuttgartiensis]CAJ74363.1 unknown protein [Candidatus Kuenenia stuttgartiensis]
MAYFCKAYYAMKRKTDSFCKVNGSLSHLLFSPPSSLYFSFAFLHWHSYSIGRLFFKKFHLFWHRNFSIS